MRFILILILVQNLVFAADCIEGRLASIVESPVSYQTVENNREIFEQSLLSGDHHSKYLEAMGFSTQPVQVPSHEHAAAFYQREMAKHIGRGRVAKDETFKLIRLYEVDGKVYTLTIGEPVPAEARLADNGVISSEMINGLMAQGKFILGGEEKLYIATNKVTEQSTFIHDLGHITGFMEEPEYAAALIRHAQGTDPSKHQGKNEALNIFIIREMIQFIKPKYRKNIRFKFTYPKSFDVSRNEIPNVLRLRDAFYDLNIEELTEIAYKNIPVAKDAIQYLGGLAREPIGRTQLNSSFFASIPETSYLLSRQIGILEQALESGNHTQIALATARMIIAFDFYSQLKPHQWVDSFQGEYLKKDSLLYKLLIQSGLYYYSGFQYLKKTADQNF